MPLLPPPYSARSSTPPGRSLSSKNSSSRNRSLSVRSKSRENVSGPAPAKKHRFTFASLRGNYQPELSRRLFRLIKSENYVINAYESAGHERQAIAAQLSEWGEQTGDDAVSELSDKLGVLLSEIGSQEEVFAQNLEEYRSILKQIRNTESSVQPSRDHKLKIEEEINRLKYKDPTSGRIATLEQELVRAEAENLVAEAQLTNVTRNKLKEAFAQQFTAVVERAEKQVILAKHGFRMLNLLDDTAVVPGQTLLPFEHDRDARQILSDAEEDLKGWKLDATEEVTTNAHPVTGGVVDGYAAASATSSIMSPAIRERVGTPPAPRKGEIGPPLALIHPAHRNFSSGSVGSSKSGGNGAVLPYPLTEAESAETSKAVMLREEAMCAVIEGPLACY